MEIDIGGEKYIVGAEGVMEIFSEYGISKSRKAAYKLISKIKEKRRVTLDGKSMIAVPKWKVEEWIRKNYPLIDDTKEIADELRIIKFPLQSKEEKNNEESEKGDDIEKIVDNLWDTIKKTPIYKIDIEEIKRKIKRIYEFLEKISEIKAEFRE